MGAAESQMFMRKLKPINYFIKQTIRLKQSYDFTLLSYERFAQDILKKVECGEISSDSLILSDKGFVPHHRAISVVDRSKQLFPRELRSTILIRLISEFEDYLVSQIRFTSSKSSRVFRGDAVVEWQRSKFDSFRDLADLKGALIESDCRMLTSSGFDEIRKYFKRYLEIDLIANGIRVAEIREIHARRHLHVHRGGRADTKYVHDFPGTCKVGQVLFIDEAYLKRAFDLLREIARHVSGECDRKFQITNNLIVGNARSMKSDEAIFLIKGEFDSQSSIQNYFDIKRMIEFGVLKAEFSELLSMAEIAGSYCEWTAIGSAITLPLFFRDLSQEFQSGRILNYHVKRLTPWFERA